ncbi:hypothetical protein HMP06_0069 [Sphingomonas sp. HMP6]|nr:hypothetical protein HMP06_0069 [Sphingomonas sp. HMP6]
MPRMAKDCPGDNPTPNWGPAKLVEGARHKRPPLLLHAPSTICRKRQMVLLPVPGRICALPAA